MPDAASQTAIYFFPPEFYQRFKARLVSSVPGILLLAPHASTLHDGVLAEAFVHADVQAGDIVYTPPLWFQGCNIIRRPHLADTSHADLIKNRGIFGAFLVGPDGFHHAQISALICVVGGHGT